MISYVQIQWNPFIAFQGTVWEGDSTEIVKFCNFMIYYEKCSKIFIKYC